MNGSNSSLPIVRKKFCFIGGHVHVDRAVPFAALARQAEVKCFLYVFVAPAIANHVAVQHFPEQVCPSAGGVHLFARNHVARTHCVLITFAVFPAAFSHTHTTQGSMCEAAVVVGELEMGWRVPRMVIG